MALLLGMGAAGLAAPRIALAIPISGEAKVAGAPLSDPTLVEEGQKITLAKGAEVRLQLLGSSKQKVLKGQSAYTVSKATLEKEGTAIARGSVSVTSEIGNLTRAGAGTARPSSYQPVGLAFAWPPALEDGRWVCKVVTPREQIKANKADAVTVTISDESAPDKPALAATVDGPIGVLAFSEKDLLPGHTYSVAVQRGLAYQYLREFRILTQEEKAALEATAHTLRMTAIATGEIPTLIRLAGVYQGFGQVEKVADVLTEAVNNPHYAALDPAVQTQLLLALNRARNGLDQKNYTPN